MVQGDLVIPRRAPVSAYDTHILRTAAAYKVDPLFLHAIIATESRHNPKAVSRVGARGLMQIHAGHRANARRRAGRAVRSSGQCGCRGAAAQAAAEALRPQLRPDPQRL
ncbi:transglycosylase SLT domain-containing protein [Ditylenchus destructor]|uniref:Transglycosylase SLT domain-containing protein n=1 Tax=Ditylenchus destructor TaxID=166010 RepID=A0AAD4MGM5_9BILA|nr:transglycosylase SLT domain-containing protein [Ditylenchus destructor]